MELISISFVQHNVINQYGGLKNLKGKINQYFSQFIDRYRDFEYVWVESKLYVDGKYGWQIKKDIEKLINKPIRMITPKKFPNDFKPVFIDSILAKQKLEERNNKKFLELSNKQNLIKQHFLKIINNIKNEESEHQLIGAFDLEFWEHDMKLILEFGWKIIDYAGKSSVTHLIVQENLKYQNGKFSKNNRFARKDSRIVPLNVALRIFKEEFIDKVEVLVGHGLNNDFKVLDMNGLKLDLDYIDTSDLGAVYMNESDKVSLERLLDYLKIEHDDLHNAANDVEYILKAFFEMGNL